MSCPRDMKVFFGGIGVEAAQSHRCGEHFHSTVIQIRQFECINKRQQRNSHGDGARCRSIRTLASGGGASTFRTRGPQRSDYRCPQ